MRCLLPLQEMGKHDRECAPEEMDSEDTLFLLYTSGSTGQPKGVVHSQAGYILYASLTHQVETIAGMLKTWFHLGCGFYRHENLPAGVQLSVG